MAKIIRQPLGSAGAFKNKMFKIKASRLDSWTYVPLNYDTDSRPWSTLTTLMNSYRAWLEANVSPQGKDWEYRTGNMFAKGIYIKDAQAATVFKLTFIL